MSTNRILCAPSANGEKRDLDAVADYTESPWTLDRVLSEERRTERVDTIVAWAKLCFFVIVDLALIVGIVWGCIKWRRAVREEAALDRYGAIMQDIRDCHAMAREARANPAHAARGLAALAEAMATALEAQDIKGMCYRAEGVL